MANTIKAKLRKIVVPRPIKTDAPITADVGATGKYWATFHKGTDFGVPGKTPVFAPASGTIQMSHFDERIGNVVWVLSKHPEYGRVRFGFFHLSSAGVGLNAVVAPGQLIGLSGNTGTRLDGSQNPYHLHFQVEVWPTREILAPVFEG